jgi:hypothetical protein
VGERVCVGEREIERDGERWRKGKMNECINQVIKGCSEDSTQHTAHSTLRTAAYFIR